MSASSEDSGVHLELGEVVAFIHGAEWVLLYSSLTGERPNSYVVRQLQDECPELQAGSVVAFSLATAPTRLCDYLAPQLRRLGLSDRWLPSGYYLFANGSLIAHHHARPPEEWSDYAAVLVVAGVALAERLYTRRWGRVADAVLPALEVTLGQRPVAALRPILRAARAQASGRGSSERSTTGDRQGRGAEPAGDGAGAGAGRASGAEESERLWSGDPHVVLGVPNTASEQDIKRAYRRLTLEHHPDKARDEQDRCKREIRQRQINLAYESIRKR